MSSDAHHILRRFLSVNDDASNRRCVRGDVCIDASENSRVSAGVRNSHGVSADAHHISCYFDCI